MVIWELLPRHRETLAYRGFNQQGLGIFKIKVTSMTDTRFISLHKQRCHNIYTLSGVLKHLGTAVYMFKDVCILHEHTVPLYFRGWAISGFCLDGIFFPCNPDCLCTQHPPASTCQMIYTPGVIYTMGPYVLSTVHLIPRQGNCDS